MGTPRRFVTLIALAALLTAACSGSGGNADGTPKPTSTSTSEAPTPVDTGTEPAPASGEYRYQNAGLIATLDLNAGTLEIENDTGRELPRPDLYVLTADAGLEIDGRVPDGAPIPDGETASFHAVFPPTLDPTNIGIVVLLMGNDNYGAFVQG